MNSNRNAALSAKEEVLHSIREALPGKPVDPALSHSRIERTYTRVGVLTREQSVDLLIDRLLDYDSEIIQPVSEEDIPEAVAEALRHRGEVSLLAPLEFPERWLPQGVRIVRDTNLTTAQLDAENVVITTCEAAVASTGTIFLVHSGAQGRRALTLLPDHHICIVARDQVYETVAAAIEAIARHSSKPITSISGPSATSDIEMTRIRGVHGPRRLTVILIGKEAALP